jgi:hypothetical protein
MPQQPSNPNPTPAYAPPSVLISVNGSNGTTLGAYLRQRSAKRSPVGGSHFVAAPGVQRRIAGQYRET